MSKIKLRAKSIPSITFTGELTDEDPGMYFVCLAPDVSPNSFRKTEWERVYDLPTTPGAYIKATIRDEPNVYAMLGADSLWYSHGSAEPFLADDDDIDPSTVRVLHDPSSDKENTQ